MVSYGQVDMRLILAVSRHGYNSNQLLGMYLKIAQYPEGMGITVFVLVFKFHFWWIYIEVSRHGLLRNLILKFRAANSCGAVAKRGVYRAYVRLTRLLMSFNKPLESRRGLSSVNLPVLEVIKARSSNKYQLK